MSFIKDQVSGHITESAMSILRDRDFSSLEEEHRSEIMALFIDDSEKPSREARLLLGTHASMLGIGLKLHQLEVMALDILMGCDKREVLDALDRVQRLLQETTPE